MVGLALAFVIDHLDGGPGGGDARVRVPDDLGAADHLLQLVDPAIEQADLFFRLLVFRVVLDVPRLEGLLEPLPCVGAPSQRDLEIALELLQPLGSQQYRFG